MGARSGVYIDRGWPRVLSRRLGSKAGSAVTMPPVASPSSNGSSKSEKLVMIFAGLAYCVFVLGVFVLEKTVL